MGVITEEDISKMSDEKLIRKINQHDSMLWMALKDNDIKDAEKHKAMSEKYRAELKLRR
jgi:hypothetical protein